MLATMKRQSAHVEPGTTRLYQPELQPLLQFLLTVLADIDFEHECDMEIVRNSTADEWLKQMTSRNLHHHHQERRAASLCAPVGGQERVQGPDAGPRARTRKNLSSNHSGDVDK